MCGQQNKITMDLENLKYSELQKLAKKCGIKANQKADKLVKALQSYYSKQNAGKNKTSAAEIRRSQKTSAEDTGGRKVETPKQSQVDNSRRSTFEKDRQQSKTNGVDRSRRSTFEKTEQPSGIDKSRRSTFEKNVQSVGTPGMSAEPGSNKRKRRSTFELKEPSVEAGTPSQSEAKKRKRHNTFELEQPTLGSPATPEVEQPFSKAAVPSARETRNTPSPGVQNMLDSMSGNMNSAERKKRLLAAIDKKVEEKMKNSPRAASGTNIPRFVTFLAQRNKETKKPVTPGNKDWQKVHKKEFAKFDSLDVYLAKRQKRNEDLSASVKKARAVLHEVQEVVTKLKSKRTPSLGKKETVVKPFKPTVTSTKNINFNFAATARRSKTSSAAEPFKPTVMSTKDMNLNFAASKTPSKEPVTKAVTRQGTPGSVRKSAGSSQQFSSKVDNGASSARKSLGASVSRKSMTTTPFKFTGALNTSQAKSTTKPAFDLKASLARPITWKPHTGKLKPMDYSLYGNTAVEGSATKGDGSRRLNLYKTHRTQSRDVRRAAAASKRTEKKSSMQMKRRGISVAP